jgi:hypothetical protein
MVRGKLLPIAMGCMFVSLLVGFLSPLASADNPSDFSLQITPSPLVLTVRPGMKSQAELKIRNGSSGPEQLKVEAQSFRYDSASGKIDLDDNPPATASWVSFSQPRFTVQAGQWFSEQIVFDTPKTAGFSYSFAVVISRQSNPKPVAGGRLIKGSVAVFTLVNVDRPDAKSSLKVVSFSSSKRLYEYLPATLNVRFQNTGNTIVQPYGNIFIQRNANSNKPLATLTVNQTKGYVLPDTARTVSAEWTDGFATYQTERSNGSTTKHLSIDWSKLSHFRIGRYSAKLVAVYNDGQHDVPIEGTVSFWVVPWRAILSFIIVVAGLWLFARWRGKHRTEKAVKRALAAQAAAHAAREDKTTSEKSAGKEIQR